MTKRFIAQVATLNGEKKYEAAGGGTFDPGEIAQKVLPNLRGGQLFAYLFRRFGYPSWAWDDDKDLTHYCLTTPLEDVFLTVRPCMDGDYPDGYDCTELMFGYCIERSIEEEYRAFYMQRKLDEWETSPRYVTCIGAFEAALRDLLRPVYVRDVPINCYGRIMDESFKGLGLSVKPYHAAGYAIPRAFFKSTDRWEHFVHALNTLGNGSFDKGIDAVIALAKESEKQHG
jgi:hypothetical protein